MADKVVFKNVHPQYDGEYEFDTSGFNHREFHTIKRLSGCRAGELENALAAGDTDVVMAIGIIVLERHGKQIDEDVFWNSPVGAITMEVEEDEVSPPVVGEPSSGSVNGSPTELSGGNTASSSENQETDPRLTGSPPSDTSATSDQPTLATSLRTS